MKCKEIFGDFQLFFCIYLFEGENRNVNQKIGCMFYF
jgi:hypothetical protein